MAPKTDSLTIDTEVAKLLLTRFLYDEINKTGFGRAVLGLSGGLDSALSCALTTAALGPDNVLALRLPYASTNSQSFEQAQLIIDELGINSETIDISPFVDPIIDVSPNMDPNRRANLMARIRMVMLQDRATAWHALVVGASNKSKLLLGYGTLFGDLASAVNPLGDLYKTQVRQLAKSMNLPALILTKDLSTDLIPENSNGRGFGITFSEVDRLLFLLVDERYSSEEAVSAGFDKQFVDKVLGMLNQSHFKRAQPIIPKLSSRSVGHDFRYLRDAGL